MPPTMIHPIKTEADYAEALHEVEALWDAEPGTAEGDHVDILATLIEAYEARHHPIEAPDPVSAILFMMEQKGASPPRSRTRDRQPRPGFRNPHPQATADATDGSSTRHAAGHPGRRASPGLRDTIGGLTHSAPLTIGTSGGTISLQPVVAVTSSTETPGAISFSAMPASVIAKSP